MAPKASRAAIAPRVEALEGRALLSTLGNPAPASNILVGFANTSPLVEQATAATVGGRIVRAFPEGTALVALPSGTNPTIAIQRLQASRFVRFAEPDGTIHAESLPVYPNDPYFSRQWGLNNPNNVDIDAPEAWSITTGDPSTIVAVIDSGIDLSNPDLVSKLWTNPGEVAGNGVDDEGDGYADDVHGWNFLNNSPDIGDTDGHGSHVAGTLGAASNNGFGITGVDWNVQIMPLKFIDQTGSGTIDAAIQAIHYAVDHGARVINASWGGQAFSQSLEAAIGYAAAHNVVFVTAAGNESANNDAVASYPANYRLGNVLSVTAVDPNGNLPSFANIGPSTVDVAAPGVSIWSAYLGGFAYLTGTSMSTPYVAGVAALMIGRDPNLTAGQVVQIIDSTAKPLPSLTGLIISGGMVDAAAALIATPAVSLSALVQPALPSDTIHAMIQSSDEYNAIHGGDSLGFVEGLYQDDLGRDVDTAGAYYWVEQLLGGASRGAVALAIGNSPEAQETKIARWFQSDLGRTQSLESLKADPTIASWAMMLVGGMSDNTIHALILSSPEYIAVHGNDPAGFVAGLYQSVLGRTVDPAGFNQWTGLLVQGYSPMAVVTAILGSPEAHVTQVARWYQHDLRRPDPLFVLKGDPAVDAIAAAIAS